MGFFKIDYSRKRLEVRNIRNVEYKLCDGETLDFDDKSFERVFMVTVIGEINKKMNILKKLIEF